MSGPFYGSLAASASVFVAILTALLINNYVEIKSQRRQTETELERVREELDKFENQRDDHEETIDELTGRREQRFKENAEERVSAFIESEVPSQVSRPIEKIDLDVLYHHLRDYHNFDSPEVMEESAENYHRQLLEEQYGQIEQAVLEDITSSFAEDYDITSRQSNRGVESKSLKEAIEEIDKQDVGGEVSSIDSDKTEVRAEGVNKEPEPLDLDKFIEDFREEYDLDTLQPETREALEQQYDKLIDRSEMEKLQSTLERLGGAGFSSSLDSMLEIADVTAGLGVQEKARLQEARKDLAHAENHIKTLERRETRLQDELSGLNPEDLKPTLFANVVTIFLSVVVPVAAYLDIVTEFAIAELAWINIWMIASSWLLGLIVVFESVLARMNDKNPRTYNFYLCLRRLLPQRQQ